MVSDKNFEEMIEVLSACRAFDRIAVTVTGGKRQLDRQYIGRAMTDLERMGAAFTINDTGDEVSITGNGPVSCIGN